MVISIISLMFTADCADQCTAVSIYDEMSYQLCFIAKQHFDEVAELVNALENQSFSICQARTFVR